MHDSLSFSTRDQRSAPRLPTDLPEVEILGAEVARLRANRTGDGAGLPTPAGVPAE